MCVNKILVRNRKCEDSSFNPVVDRFYNRVPCNRCDDCLAFNQSSYATRAIFEYISNKNNGGRTFFYTLTYNDLKIPRYKGKPCFNVSVVQKFLKRLRKNFDKLGISFKYFLSSECGDKTFRPHHHILFYLDQPFNSVKFRKLLDKTWLCGFVKPGKFNGVVNSVIPCSYVAKYVTKDKNFVEYLQNYDITVDFLKEFEEFKYYTKDSRSFRPFHLQSVGFGISMSDFITDTDLVNGYVILNNSSGISKKYPIPLYILRKLLYTSSINDKGNVVYRLNEKGCQIRSEQIINSAVDLSLEFESLFRLAKSHFNCSPLISSNFDNYDHFHDFVLETLHGCCDFDDLSYYYLLYHDLPHFNFSYTNFKEDVHNYFRSVLFNHDLPFKPTEFDNQLYSFFSGYDFVINCLFDLKKYFAYERYKDNVNSYNASQYERSSLSKEKPKLMRLKSFSEFIDKNVFNLCSITSKRRKENSLFPSLSDQKFSRPLMMSLF